MDVELGQCFQHRGMEIRNRLGGERYAPLAAIAGMDDQRMIEEVEVDRERPPIIGYG